MTLKIVKEPTKNIASYKRRPIFYGSKNIMSSTKNERLFNRYTKVDSNYNEPVNYNHLKIEGKKAIQG